MTSAFNTDCSLPYNHDLFGSLIVKKRSSVRASQGSVHVKQPPKVHKCKCRQLSGSSDAFWMRHWQSAFGQYWVMIGCWFQTFDQSYLGLMSDRQRPKLLANMVQHRFLGRSSA
ncbi:hypothetical protein T265_03233 [Opisthorchis viverrini]|uniref:Uncharacterized protein n=1 Tax=Opisthorchis viverrini TaxID=6198 RepID=A0A074ZWL0_OPIVI|nr:hypothetical protein T265_03233 [Opisthorchis viverrini]KER30282.1 hypothetical protein T265_03233 [Opisthorchis viverrini]